MKLAGWGRFPVSECRVEAARCEADVLALAGNGDVIARGNGRAYGDSAANPRCTIDMRKMNRMIAFDTATGQLAAEAGVLLGDVIDTFLPRGWFPAVTPGTKFVSLGGAIAADVHGKNHHKHGSFGSFVDWIEICGADGQVRRCSRSENTELFAWTLGGMGLTGVILRAAFRLRRVASGWIRQTLIPAADLDAAMDIFEASQDATYSVAWIDCLARGRSQGRSLVMLGEHALVAELPRHRHSSPYDTGNRRARSLPVDVPRMLLNPLTVEAFNDLYYWYGKRKVGHSLVDWDSYFYPLDAILQWNRIYGKRGFAQFQCVLPLEASKSGLAALLSAIAADGGGSFLAVLKRFGAQEGKFSFPMPGYTLALDFPVSARNLTLLEELDAIVLAHGGRFYLAKDSRMSRETFHRSEPRSDDFIKFRGNGEMQQQFRSAQSDRLGL